MDYHIVFTPSQQDIPTLRQVADAIVSATEASRYICSREVGQKSGLEHFHLTLQSQISIETCRARIKKHYKDLKTLSIKKVKDHDKSVQYTLKDGEFIYEHYDPFYIIKQKELSYRKDETEDKFQKQIDNAIEFYVKDTSPYADADFYEKLCNIYIQHNRKFVWVMIDKIYIMAHCKKDKRFLRDTATSRIQKLNNIAY